jgi:hypothetical protein
VSQKEQDRIAVADLMLDVEGLEDGDGKPLKYTRELGANECFGIFTAPLQYRLGNQIYAIKQIAIASPLWG